MKNLNLINEEKQDIVKNICLIAERMSIVHRVIIFGSSITNDCREGSDLDICFDIYCDTTDMRLFELRATVNKICHFNCDFVVYSHVGDRLKNIIDRTGVVVLDRK